MPSLGRAGPRGHLFCEQHRQHFHADADVGAAFQDAGFAAIAVGEEYTNEPADASTLRATLDRTAFFSDLNWRIGRPSRTMSRDGLHPWRAR
jgi:hypothetical protein